MVFEKIRVVIPPYSIDVDGVRVDVLEVLRTRLVSGETWYHVVCRVRYGNLVSKPFTVDCRNEKEFIEKIRVEVSKVKLMEIIHGLNYVRQVIT